jgi:cytochrome c biogenesis protein CcmG/thiol:disulfide interchange protein DsbE
VSGVKRNIVVFALMVVVVAGLLMLAKHRLGSRITPSTGPAGTAAASTPGHDAPDFVLTDLQGHTVKLSDLRGKAVVLNFWATWCPPCKEEIPWLVDLQKRYGGQGLQIVGINMDDGDPKDVVKFAAENSINYPILFGQDKVADLYGGIEYLPTTFYIDRNGVVLDRVFGQPERAEIEKNIQRVIATTAKPVSQPARPAGSAALPVSELAEIR